MRLGTSGSSNVSASSRRILPCVVVSASRRSSASSALRRACSSSFLRSPRCGTSIDDLATGALGQRLLQQLAIGQLAIDQDAPRRRHVLVELDEEARHHFVLRHVAGMRREEGAMAPILPAADEEGLDRHRPGLAGQREDVGIAQPLGMHRLDALDVGQRAQAVAVDGGELVVLLLGRLRPSASTAAPGRRSTCRPGSSSHPRPARHSRPRRSAPRMAPSSA